MPPAIKAVQTGQMYTTVRNPFCRIHGGAILAGVSAVMHGAETGTNMPKNIVTDDPVVAKANANGILWVEEQFLI
jgi:ribose transport system substrate-binding protein